MRSLDRTTSRNRPTARRYDLAMQLSIASASKRRKPSIRQPASHDRSEPGNNLTLKLSLTLKPAFAGAKANVGYATDASTASTGLAGAGYLERAVGVTRVYPTHRYLSPE